MLVFVAIPVIVAVAFVHRFVHVVAPSNMLARSVRSAAPRWRVAAALLGLAAVLLMSMQALAIAVSAGAPGWLNLVVLVLVWDAVKVGWLAVGVVVRRIAGFARQALGHARRGDRRRLRRIGPVSDDPSLFGDDEPAVPPTQVSAPAPIAEWQRALIRKALDARGLTSMEDRQLAVEGPAGRAVLTLRDLTHDEAIRVLNRLGESGPSGDRSASQWGVARRGHLDRPAVTPRASPRRGAWRLITGFFRNSSLGS